MAHRDGEARLERADSRHLAAAKGRFRGQDDAVTVWEAGTWQPVFGPHMMTTRLNTDVAWSRKGQRLAILGFVDRTDICPPRAVEVMCSSSGSREQERSPVADRFQPPQPGNHDLGRSVEPGRPLARLCLQHGIDGGVPWAQDLGRVQGTDCVHARGHTNVVRSVAWSPDGRRLGSASDDGTVKVWDVSCGEELLTFRGKPDTPFTSVAFSPDGRRIVASQGNTMIVWDATPRD